MVITEHHNPRAPEPMLVIQTPSLTTPALVITCDVMASYPAYIIQADNYAHVNLVIYGIVYVDRQEEDHTTGDTTPPKPHDTSV